MQAQALQGIAQRSMTLVVLVTLQAIASRLEDPEHHTIPPVVEQVKDKVLQDHAAHASTSASGQSTATKSSDAQPKTSEGKSSGESSNRQVS